GGSAPGGSAPGGSAPDAGRVRVELDEPVHGLALGQAAVLYTADDAVCLGGGRVIAAERPAGLPVASVSPG
ncbi:MAG: aminomethyltransferase beta-barrel domain-containing protein, partial [Actinomycetota bacterium]